MTNLERIKQMDAKELAEEFTEYAEMEARQYADFEKWLNSEDPDMPYKGVCGRVKMYDDTVKCIIVGERTIFGNKYKTVIIDGRIYSVPSGEVIV